MWINCHKYLPDSPPCITASSGQGENKWNWYYDCWCICMKLWTWTFCSMLILLLWRLYNMQVFLIRENKRPLHSKYGMHITISRMWVATEDLCVTWMPEVLIKHFWLLSCMNQGCLIKCHPGEWLHNFYVLSGSKLGLKQTNRWVWRSLHNQPGPLR